MCSWSQTDPFPSLRSRVVVKNEFIGWKSRHACDFFLEEEGKKRILSEVFCILSCFPRQQRGLTSCPIYFF